MPGELKRIVAKTVMFGSPRIMAPFWVFLKAVDVDDDEEEANIALEFHVLIWPYFAFAVYSLHTQAGIHDKEIRCIKHVKTGGCSINYLLHARLCCVSVATPSQFDSFAFLKHVWNSSERFWNILGSLRHLRHHEAEALERRAGTMEEAQI